MKKIYTIEITGYEGHPNIWYATKVGRTYETELFCRSDKEACFKVRSGLYVFPIHCKIVDERTEDKYQR